MNSVEEIDELRRIDILTAKRDSLDKSINEANHALSLLETMQENLSSQHSALNLEIDELEITNQKYLDSTNKVPHYKDSHKTLEFFDQLKILEAETEYIDATLEARRKNINDLKSHLSASNSQLKRLETQISELNDTLEKTQKTEHERESAIKILKQKIFDADDEYNRTQDICENLKVEIQNQADEMKEISPEAMELLVLQKDTLIEEVRKGQEEVNKLEARSKQNQSKYAAQDNFQQKKLDKEASPLVWMSERNSLLIKIKKAQQELAQLNQRDRSANKTREKTSQLAEESQYSEDDVKKALYLELQEIMNQQDTFMEDAIETETNYREELKNQIKEIDQTADSINSFKDGALDLMKQHNTIASGKDRLELLRQELHDLKSKL
ncbi:hypothetical protein TVAG_317780 [Trichomonas vaginalis G3]|uniref:Uncharacterized protein n=1 Tax=Trichomonas vaginalis (strain ATCC PRA-98 / G3) TaxID=412133 RepID=A2F3M5_TRIV3|nr:tropomyosin family [Trichomonas vaginalis G3]EAY00493.1 hypothetical protein TVAG_317780 [Trichomonas vaginalis G3]KAI5520549.1 tropomyosin family [Trichomonas vaginalis G3]|eukprot:XP_001313422.1 hypothetical protein [Trichomonas vaginalis G3]